MIQTAGSLLRLCLLFHAVSHIYCAHANSLFDDLGSSAKDKANVTTNIFKGGTMLSGLNIDWRNWEAKQKPLSMMAWLPTTRNTTMPALSKRTTAQGEDFWLAALRQILTELKKRVDSGLYFNKGKNNGISLRH